MLDQKLKLSGTCSEKSDCILKWGPRVWLSRVRIEYQLWNSNVHRSSGRAKFLHRDFLSLTRKITARVL